MIIKVTASVSDDFWKKMSPILIKTIKDWCKTWGFTLEITEEDKH